MFEVQSPLAGLCHLSGRLDPWPLIERLGPPSGAWTRAALKATELRASAVKRIVATQEFSSEHPFVCAGEPEYPSALVGVPFAPTVLFYEGNLALCDERGVAVVGARRCTPDGLSVAGRLAGAVCGAGGVVVSGLASGIDSAAHRASGGRTIGVMGHGLSSRGRAGLAGLVRWVVEQGGLVLSEFPPLWPPSRFSFPQRNRTIAALAQATVVVQAGARSGSLITARFAGEVGREVLAVPGSMDAPAYAGCLRLISQGAAVVQSERTVLDAAGLAGAVGGARLPLHARQLEDALAIGGRVDEISARTGLTFDVTFRLVARLEAEGWVVREPGQRYRIADRGL